MSTALTLDSTLKRPRRPSASFSSGRKRRILFAKLGSFSHTNERLLEQLNRHFSDYEIITFDVKEYIKRQYGRAALNACLEAMIYGPAVLSNPSDRHAYFFRTPFMFQHLSETIVKQFGAQSSDFEFVFQTQGMFNAALPRTPLVIYTDYTIASHREHQHNDPRLFRSKRFFELERKLYHRADRIVVSAAHVENTLIQSYGCDPERLATILIGANVEAPPTPDNLDRYSSGRILFVGIDWERKGGRTLLAAFDKISARFPHARLTIAGCSPTLTNPHVQATGLIPRPDVAKLFAESAIFCLPSVVEPSAVASVEAMAFKLPVVATNIGGFPGMVKHGETGLLVAPNDPDALAAALADLLTNPERARSMGLAGYQRSQDLFTWDAVGARLQEQIGMLSPAHSNLLQP